MINIMLQTLHSMFQLVLWFTGLRILERTIYAKLKHYRKVLFKQSTIVIITGKKLNPKQPVVSIEVHPLE